MEPKMDDEPAYRTRNGEKEEGAEVDWSRNHSDGSGDPLVSR